MDNDSAVAEGAARLDEPTAEAVREAFVALPRRGGLTCLCGWDRRLEILSALEECGAFAIRLEPDDGFARARIVALKGKAGPCYDTGRRAVYRGSAAAVLDDDRHLIVGEIRVCEKTGGIYRLKPYRGALSVTEADPALLARLDSDPVPFDCNTFDADSQRLTARMESDPRSAGRVQDPADGVAVVYPGPFRALVLPDGSVVRRGVAVRIAAEYSAQNGFLRLPPGRSVEAQPCERYAAACRARGPAFILEPLAKGPLRPAEAFDEARPLDDRARAALRAAPAEIKRRLLRLIDGREPYWVLTGSDPEVAGGCCPSTAVGGANRLVAAGALQAYAPPEACTVSVYAFPGEIGNVGMGAASDARPTFRICEEVRGQAAAALRAEGGDRLKRAARTVLLAVLGASLGLAAWRALAVADAAPRRCFVCARAEAAVRRVEASPGPAAGVTVSLGALAAVQPCALAALAAALAVAWRPVTAERAANVRRNGLLVAGMAVATTALALATAWGLGPVVARAAEWMQVFKGPLLVLAGLALTGLFRVPAVAHAPCGGRRPFFVGAGLGLFVCPVGVALFAGAVLPGTAVRGSALGEALLFGTGYSAALAALVGILVAGGRVAVLQRAGRIAGATAGWTLAAAGLLLS